MIKSIKQFVNKHQTLIVIIIAMKVIYFFYWLLYCKNKVANIKGGTLDINHYKKYKYKIGDGTEQTKIFLCAGINIVGDLLFIVLNEHGRASANHNSTQFNNFITYVKNYLNSKTNEDKLSLITLVKAPLRIFIPRIHSGSVLNKFIEYAKNRDTESSIRKGDTILTLNEVNFNEISNITYLKARKEIPIGKFVIERYNQLVDFLTKDEIHPYIEEVNFIGQPSVYATNMQESTINSTFETKFSPDVRSNLNGNIYEKLVDELHDWYPNNRTDKNNIFRTYIYINKSSREIKSSNAKINANSKENESVIDYKIRKEDETDLGIIKLIIYTFMISKK